MQVRRLMTLSLVPLGMAWVIMGLSLGGCLLTGCMLGSTLTEKGAHAIEYRIGLEDVSIVHGALVLPMADTRIELGSDIGAWIMKHVVSVLP